ncbi:MAG: hypothetical protein AABZ60_24945, partial [Planctomycetota bacterium]
SWKKLFLHFVSSPLYRESKLKVEKFSAFASMRNTAFPISFYTTSFLTISGEGVTPKTTGFYSRSIKPHKVESLLIGGSSSAILYGQR